MVMNNTSSDSRTMKACAPSVQFVIPHIKPRFDLSVPYGRTVYRALHADSTRFAEKFDLIVQAVQSVPRVIRLALVQHHHRHRRDFLLGSGQLYRIVARLPERDGVFEYRIRLADGRREEIAKEANLSATSRRRP